MTRLNKSKLWSLAFVACLFAAPAAWSQTKIAVVDYGRLVEESPQAKTALDAHPHGVHAHASARWRISPPR